MTKLSDLIPASPTPDSGDDYRYSFYNKIQEMMDGMLDISNQSQLLTPDFNTLSAKGLNPTVPADGDNTEFIGNWFIVGAANATYIITPTAYPNNSTIRSGSQYFVSTVVSAWNGNAFYFYQRQANTVRKYQKRYLTFTLHCNNNSSTILKVQFNVSSFYDPSTSLATNQQGKTINLNPGYNDISSTILMDTLSGVVVGAANYTEFRLNFIDLATPVSADIDFYLLKCEYGKLSTPYTT
jgi:hypothetical protein